MPCIGWVHPVTRAKIPLDYFDSDEACTVGGGARNGAPAYPPWAARFRQLKIQTDVRHSALDLTTTRCTTCPRETFLEVLFDYYADPDGVFVMDRGTALHEIAAKSWNPAVFLSEHTHPGLLTVAGELFGVKLSGLIDAARFVPADGTETRAPGNTTDDARIVEIIDLKFPRDTSGSFRKKQAGRAKVEHAFQLNVGRLLLAQQPWAIDAGYDPDTVKLTVWDHANPAGNPPEPLDAVHMSEADMLRVKPLSMDHTVREIIDMHQAAITAWAEVPHEDKLKNDDAKREIAARIPLFGQSSNWKCKYCSVEPLCSELVREHGMPGVTS